MDKLLSEWTLGEAKNLCKDNNNCTTCPFLGGSSGGILCRIGYPESMWNLGVEITEPTPAAKDTNSTDKPDKPRLAEVLGVEVGEQFRISREADFKGIVSIPYIIDENGYFVVANKNEDGRTSCLCYAINHPESIIRAPRLTEAELAICKAVGAKWVTKPKTSALNAVHLWSQKPKQLDDGDFKGDGTWLGCVNGAFIRSVCPGDCIEVEEAGGE